MSHFSKDKTREATLQCLKITQLISHNNFSAKNSNEKINDTTHTDKILYFWRLF